MWESSAIRNSTLISHHRAPPQTSADFARLYILAHTGLYEGIAARNKMLSLFPYGSSTTRKASALQFLSRPPRAREPAENPHRHRNYRNHHARAPTSRRPASAAPPAAAAAAGGAGLRSRGFGTGNGLFRSWSYTSANLEATRSRRDVKTRSFPNMGRAKPAYAGC